MKLHVKDLIQVDVISMPMYDSFTKIMPKTEFVQYVTRNSPIRKTCIAIIGDCAMEE